MNWLVDYVDIYTMQSVTKHVSFSWLVSKIIFFNHYWTSLQPKDESDVYNSV